MSIHKKMAIIMAPFLLLIGWIAADYYDEQQKFRNNHYQLLGAEDCNLGRKDCVLTFEQLKIQLQSEKLPDGRVVRLISSHEMENVRISVVDKRGNETPILMQPFGDEYQWQAYFPGDVNTATGNYRVRFAGSNSSGYFYAEVQG